MSKYASPNGNYFAPVCGKLSYMVTTVSRCFHFVTSTVSKALTKTAKLLIVV